jgi:hypothetical protein
MFIGAAFPGFVCAAVRSVLGLKAKMFNFGLGLASPGLDLDLDVNGLVRRHPTEKAATIECDIEVNIPNCIM